MRGEGCGCLRHQSNALPVSLSRAHRAEEAIAAELGGSVAGKQTRGGADAETQTEKDESSQVANLRDQLDGKDEVCARMWARDT